MIDKKELITVVDETNKPVGAKPRDEVHSKGLWHRNSHVWVINSNDEILCQRRSLKKDSNPGLWEPFFGGHPRPGQDYIKVATREVKEELGLKVKESDFVLFKIYKDTRHKEFQSIYKLHWDAEVSKINFDKEEVEELRWVPISQIKDTIVFKKDTHWTVIGYEKEVLNWLTEM